jgi:DNA-3-methyladenine glycosylase II
MTDLREPLTEETLRSAAMELADRDPDIAKSLDRLGVPPLWCRDPGFPTLVHIILEQQVSLSSARAAFNKLTAAVAVLEPATFMTLDDAHLKAFGFSGQKGRYCRELATAILEEEIDLEGLGGLAEDDVRTELMRIKGIGRWTADIYLLMVLCRPEIWPRGDLALHKAVQDLKGLPATPAAAEFEQLGESWRPWRAVAARMLWNHYLHPPTDTTEDRPNSADSIATGC